MKKKYFFLSNVSPCPTLLIGFPSRHLAAQDLAGDDGVSTL